MSAIYLNRADTQHIQWNYAALDSLADLTVIVIVKPEGNAASNETILSKDSTLGGSSFILRRRASPNGGSLEVIRDGATDEQVISDNTVITSGNWYWIGFRSSFGTAPTLHVGSPHTRPTEVTYATQTTGSVQLDGSSAWNAGRKYDVTEKFGGRVAFVGIADAQLAVNVMLTHWPIPRKTPGVTWLMYTWPGFYGALSAIDWSGNRRDGTVSAAPTIRNGPPVPSPIVGVGLAA